MTNISSVAQTVFSKVSIPSLDPFVCIGHERAFRCWVCPLQADLAMVTDSIEAMDIKSVVGLVKAVNAPDRAKIF